MPKITAATLADHQIAQRHALIQAAMRTLLESGATSITPAEVGRRAGLARSSVYQYFPSTAALIEAVVEESFPPWNAALDEALAGIDDPADRITAYIDATLRLTAAGHHRAAGALLRAELPESIRDRLNELHRQTTAPLGAAIRDLGVPDPALTGRLLGGLLQAAMAAVEDGAELATVSERVQALLADELGSPKPPQQPK